MAAALADDGPAFLRVHAPSAEGHAADATLERAQEALASGAFPLLLSPAGAPGRPELGQLAEEPSDRPDEPDPSAAAAPAPAAITAVAVAM